MYKYIKFYIKMSVLFPTLVTLSPLRTESDISDAPRTHIKAKSTFETFFPNHLFGRVSNTMSKTINVDLHENTVFEDAIALERMANPEGFKLISYGKDFF